MNRTSAHSARFRITSDGCIMDSLTVTPRRDAKSHRSCHAPCFAVLAMSVSDVPELPADWIWLTSERGRRWRTEMSGANEPLHQQVSRLRKQLTAEQTRRLLEQLTLQRRAATRFPRCDEMFFTDKGLEQATDATVAAYKARRFEDRAVVDLCCGIGGDLMALAERGPTLGIDWDPACVHVARANLQVVASQYPVDVAMSDVEQLSVLPNCAIHIDPDRRPQGRRSTQMEFHRPSIKRLEEWTTHPQGCAIKLAPATDREHPLLQDAELEWIGHRRSCQTLVAWFGPLAQTPAHRCATVIDAYGVAHRLEQTMAVGELPMTAQIGTTIVEPAPSVLAAGLASEVALRHHLSALTPGGGYLTTPASHQSGPHGSLQTDSPHWTCFDVLESLPFKRAKLQRCLKALNVGTLEVKTRGIAEDAVQLQKRLSRSEGKPATLFLFKQGAQTCAVVARRRVEQSA